MRHSHSPACGFPYRVFSRATVGEDDGAASRANVRPTFAGETDDVRVVEGAVLRADRGAKAHAHDDGELTYAGRSPVSGVPVSPCKTQAPGLIQEDQRRRPP